MKPQQHSAVIEFPKGRLRPQAVSDRPASPAEVVIFPGVRVERLVDEAPERAAQQKRPG
jgi:hypothetical protein